MTDTDDEFWNRADAHIHLSNSQISDDSPPGKVSASHMYSMARFAAWLTFIGVESAEELRAEKEQSIAYFLDQFEKMLIENFDDHYQNFEQYAQK